MPDVLHWLGITQDPPLRLDEQHEARRHRGRRHRDRRAGADPRRADPADARVEMDAKMAAGYFTDGDVPDAAELASPRGADCRERRPGGRRRGRLSASSRGDPRARRRGAGPRARRRARALPRRPRLALHARAELRRRDHPRPRYPDRSTCRCTAAGGTSTWAASTARRGARRAPGAPLGATSARGRGSTSRSSACCSTPAPGDVALSRGRDRPGRTAARRAWRSPASACSPRGALLRATRADAAARRRGGAAAADARIAWREASRFGPTIRCVGLDGRAALLRGSGRRRSTQRPICSASDGRGRAPASTRCARRRPTAAVRARADVLVAVLTALGSIWPGRTQPRRRAARRRLAPPAAGGQGPPAPAGAVPQALAVADLLAARAARARPASTSRTSTR